MENEKRFNTEEKRNPDGTFAVGTAPGPGRPKGKSLKEFAREYLMNLPDDQKKAYLDKLPQELVWRMSEGNPHQTTDARMDVHFPKPIADVLQDDGVQKDTSTE